MEEMKFFKSKDELDYSTLSKNYESIELDSTQEVAVVGYAFILQRVKQLGLRIAKFEPLHVINNVDHNTYFSEFFENNPDVEGVFSHSNNSIGSRYRPSLTLLTHEMLHYFTAIENIPNLITNKEKLKSGFHSNFLAENSQDDSVKDYFQCLNEGITDKLAFDLYKNVSAEDIGLVYKKIFPKKAQEEVKYYKEQLRWVIKDLEERRIKYISEIKTTEHKDKQQKEIDEINNSIDFSVMRAESYWNNRADCHISVDFVKHMHDEEDSPYKPFIELVDQLLEGVTLMRQKEFPNKNTEEVKKLAWSELQKAYFTGSTIYLRVLENIYGEGFLRKLARLDMEELTVINDEWIELDELLNIIKKKNKELSESL